MRHKNKTIDYSISFTNLGHLELCGIYYIFSKKTKQYYVGSTKGTTESKIKATFHNRWRTHNYKLMKNQHYNYKLQNNFNENGKTNFIFGILEIIPIEQSFEFLWERELYWINYYDSLKSGFNISNNFQHPVTFNRIVRQETKDRIRNKLLGKTRPESVKRKLGNPVLQFDREGNFIAEYYSIQEASTITGTWRQDIGKTCLGKLHTANNFIWRYKNK